MINKGTNLKFYVSNVAFSNLDNWNKTGGATVMAGEATLPPGGSLNQALSDTSNGLSASTWRKIEIHFKLSGELDTSFNFLNRLTIGFLFTYNHTDGTIHRNHGVIVVARRDCK